MIFEKFGLEVEDLNKNTEFYMKDDPEIKELIEKSIKNIKEN